MEDYSLPRGYISAGVSSGVKKKGGDDLGLIFSRYPCRAAALFTCSRLKSSHIKYDKKILKSKIKGILVNSGNANVFTGKRGEENTKKTAGAAELLLGVKKGSIAAASTGVIGVPLPVKKIVHAMPRLIRKLSPRDKKFPVSILTTDTFQKVSVKTIKAGKNKIKLTGVAKGAGMIKPDMATMLAFIATDAGVTPALLKKILRRSAAGSFNRITVDGDMSPNDSLFILANGASGVTITEKSILYKKFLRATGEICRELSEMIVRDGEGATKFVRINVYKAASEKQAKNTAEKMANSLLFKTALYGGLNNMGRIPSIIGASGERVAPEKIMVKVNGITAVNNGKIINSSGISKQLKKKNIIYDILLNTGKKEYYVLTTDLSVDYVKINAEYS